MNSQGKLTKVLLIFLAVFCIGATAFGFYVSYYLKNIQAPLISALRSQIDGELKIEKAKVHLFPFGLDLKNIQLFAPQETTPSTSIEEAKLRFNLIPLVQKKFEGALTVVRPEVHFRYGKDGKSNMQKIFAPILAGESDKRLSSVDQLWWKRVAVNKLKIEKAQFTTTRAGSAEKTELKNISIEADRIRFDRAQAPAKIKLSYDIPQVSKMPMEVISRLQYDDQIVGFHMLDGEFNWGDARMQFGGETLLPSPKRDEVMLDLHFKSNKIDLKKLGKMLNQKIPASGTLAMSGTVKGTAFAPLLRLVVDSPSLQVSGKNLSNFHAELTKKDKPVNLQNTHFGIFGGNVNVSGQAIPGPTTSAKLNIGMKSLSIAEISGKKDQPARLNGNLQISAPNIQNLNAISGGGKISVGPIPIPNVDLKNKVRVAEVLAAGAGVGPMINVGMLSNSSNVIGRQINQIDAIVGIQGKNISLTPYSMANSHFTSSGNASVIQQKTIQGGGVFNLNPSVTAQLITDPALRHSMTEGKGGLSVPYTISGPVEDPKIQVNNDYLKKIVSKAAVATLRNVLTQGIQPDKMVESALNQTPLGDPKNPLNQILRATQPPPQKNPIGTTSTTTTPTRTTTTTRTNTTTPQTNTTTPQKKTTTNQKILDQLLFGK